MKLRLSGMDEVSRRGNFGGMETGMEQHDERKHLPDMDAYTIS
ncbi:MAG: hypothetical protein ACOX5R_12135 [bacterium]|jgi:hypothetical protein